MGPPGCGKSHLGRLLHEQGLAHFHDLEPELLAQFGSGEDFAANKPAALAWIEQQLILQLEGRELPVIIQSTGLSDRELLLRLMSRWRLALISIDAPAELCAQRVATRPPGQNLSNDPAHTAEFHAYWWSQVAPHWDFNGEVGGVDSAADLQALRELLAPETYWTQT